MTDKEVNKMKKNLTKWEEEQQKQFEEYCAKVDSTMWKGISLFLIICFTALLIGLIFYK